MLRIETTPRSSTVRLVGVTDMSGTYWVVRESGQDVRRFYGASAYTDASSLAKSLRATS